MSGAESAFGILWVITTAATLLPSDATAANSEGFALAAVGGGGGGGGSVLTFALQYRYIGFDLLLIGKQ